MIKEIDRDINIIKLLFRKYSFNNSNFIMILSIFSLIISKIIIVFIPIVYANIINLLTNPEKTDVYAYGPVMLIILYGVLRILSSLFLELRDGVFVKVQQHITKIVTIDAFAHLINLPVKFHVNQQTGGLSRVIDRGMKGIQTSLSLIIVDVLPIIIELLLVTSVISYIYGWLYALIIIFLAAIYITVTALLINWRMRVRREMNEANKKNHAHLVDTLLNASIIKVYNNQKYELDKFDKNQELYEKFSIKNLRVLNLSNFCQSSIIALGLLSVMLLSAHEIQAGTLTVGYFVAVNAYLMQLYQPLSMLSFFYREIRQGLVDMDEMFSLFDEKTEQDLDAIDSSSKSMALSGEDLRSGASVTFDEVFFHYSEGRDILKGLSFHIPKGQSLAIVGQTGAGKSTISQLLFRFYDPHKGKILLDGQNTADFTREEVRQHIGIVPQDTILFNDTIKNNIAYGCSNASAEEIIHAAKSAQLHHFVEMLSKGYETQVGERGVKLSGGERQRIAIARMLLKKPRLVILDEATSALDTRTEEAIQQALNEVTAQRTAIIIAHRLSTVVQADQIMFLEDGVACETGTHLELIKLNGKYAQLWHAQLKENENIKHHA